jgi:DNA-binding transcriptional MerR regulator
MVRAMSVEALACASGETIETVRLCEREGLLGEVWRDRRGRRYDSRALAVLRLVRLGQRLGVELDDIRAAIPALGDPRRIRGVMRGWAQARLARLAHEQRELRRMQGLLCGFLTRSSADEHPDWTRVARETARLGRDLTPPASREGHPGRGTGPARGARQSALPGSNRPRTDDLGTARRETPEAAAL